LNAASIPTASALVVWHVDVFSTSQVSSSVALRVRLERGRKDGGARPESVHPSMGKNSQAPCLRIGHIVVFIRLSCGNGKG
jgi:hypothetical protein